ncbi:MAG: MBL fold metallo-hydrolase [Candidatus Hodarchaeota archaeon]
MHVQQITPNFWAILSYGMGSNKYVLKSADFNLLIDPGAPGEGSKLLSVLKSQLSLDPEDIHAILLTHVHGDHSGAVSHVKEASNADLYVHEVEAHFMEGPDHSLTLLRMFGDQPQPAKVKKRLKEGEVLLKDGDISWVVLHTPGHSPGSICLYNKEEGLLITGDTIFERGNIGRTDLRGGDNAALVESITRLTQLEVKSFFPGHMGIAMENPKKQILQSLQFAKNISFY